MWTAGAVFLAAWLPFNNGLRPEPLIAFGAVAVWMLVENAIATRRLWPAAVAIVVAVFSVTLAPQGLIALAPLLVGSRAIARVIADRRRQDGAAGLLAALAPLGAAAALIFVVVFRDQTLAAVAESARIKYVVGPTIAWYQDFLRYYFLTVEDSVDGSLTRRFAVLLLLLCLFGMLAVLLRRGQVPGVASGPVWRLIGSTAIGLLLLTFTPTKWAVQFGAFAGLAGALGAVTAFAFSRVGLHSRRNLALYVTALLFVLAWATSGINGWFYVGNYGVPWFDRQPVILHQPVTTMFLVLAIVTGLLAGWLHFRMDYTGHTEVENTRRNRVLASTPLLVVASIMVVLEVGSMAKGFVQRYPVYTTGKAEPVRHRESGLSDTSCAMADDVLVEPDTNAGMLQPVPGQKCGRYGPLGGQNPVGFTPNGVSDALEPPNPVVANPGTVNSDGSPNKPNVGIAFAAGTGGGYGPVGVNGSRVFLPFGLDPARTPVMGSYDENTVAAKATSAWYQLPPRTPDRPLVTVAAAGAIWYYDEDARVQLRAVAQAAVGCAPSGRQFPGAERGSADRRVRPEGVAQPAVPAGVGAAGGQRGAHRRRRPEPVHRPVVRLHPATGAGAADRTAVPRFTDPGADGHRHRRELPVPAAVLRTPRRRRTAGVPDPAQPQAGGGVVEHVAVRRGRRPVPVHPGAADHRDGADLSARRLVPRLGFDRALQPRGPATQAPNAVIEQGSMTVFGWSRSRTDQGTAMTARRPSTNASPPPRPATGPGHRDRALGGDRSPACSASCCPSRHRCCRWCRPPRR